MDATNSLQQPDSPMTKTGKFVSAILSTCFITSMNVSLPSDVMLPLFIQSFRLYSRNEHSADVTRGQQPRPGRRPPFHARGFHPVYNARVSSKKNSRKSYAMRGGLFD